MEFIFQEPVTALRHKNKQLAVSKSLQLKTSDPVVIGISK